MDIHKPKPIHNWREFLKEYAIIVIGVLTALAGEQAVEWMHWQGEVQTARQAVHAEIATNNDYLLRRTVLARCLDRQADEAAKILDDLAVGRSPSRFTVFHPGAHYLLNESDWQSERAAQTLTHFPRAELALLGRYYALLPLMRGWLDQEAAAWLVLSALREPPRDVAAGNLLRLRAALATARWTGGLLSLNARRELNISRRLGVASPTLNRTRVNNYCTQDDEAYMKYTISAMERE